MIDPQQLKAFDDLVRWARDNQSYALLNSLVEDGPDNVTDFAGLLVTFTARADAKKDTRDIL
jgi:hypothetical protein